MSVPCVCAVYCMCLFSVVLFPCVLGSVYRLCNVNGQWEETDVGQCQSEEFADILQTVRREREREREGEGEGEGEGGREGEN